MIWRLLFDLRRFLTRRPRLVAGWAAALVVMFVWVLPLKTWWPNDFYGFWIVGQTSRTMNAKSVYGIFGMVAVADAARAGADVAPTGLERQMRRFYKVMSSTASPFHYAAVKLASTGDLKLDYAIFRRTSAVVWSLGILAFASYLRFPWWSLPLLIYFCTLPFWPYRRDIMDGNNSALIAGAMMLVCLGLRSPRLWARFATGFAFGLLAMFKPTVLYGPVIAAFVLLVTDRRGCWAYCAGGIAAAAVAFVIPSYVLGPTVQWERWFEHAPKSAFQGRGMTGGIFGRFIKVETIAPIKAFTALTLGACAAALAWGVRGTGLRIGIESPHRPRGFAYVAAAAVGLAAYLVCGVMLWGHYFTLAVPVALIALRPRPHRPDRGVPAIILGVAAFALIGFHQHMRNNGLTDHANYSPFTIAGTALAIAIVLWDVWDSGRLRPAPERTSPPETAGS